MAWETRGKARYYYRARRENGRVHKEYFGHGIEAQRAAEQDEAARKAREKEREQIRAIDEATRPARDLVAELERGSLMLYQATLLAAGYHCHRGHWRRKRND